MSKVSKFTGTQVKELLAKVKGIYVAKNITDILTDYFSASDLVITDDGLEIAVNQFTTIKLPIAEESYINYAIDGENDDEEWDGSTYFDYKFYIEGYMICFNVKDKGNTLTLEQLKELVETKRIRAFRAESIDGGSFSISASECIIDVDIESYSPKIELITNDSNIILDSEIINAIYNDSDCADDICYRIEFNNGVPDITIEPRYGYTL